MFDMGKRGNKADAEQDVPTMPEAVPSVARTRVHEAAVIGPSIHLNGELRGEEDLVVHGTVSGTVRLADNGLTVGASGKLVADVYARTVVVDGTVEGDIYGSERVVIRKTGSAKGNIISPRISLEDGARFKGSMEMDPERVSAVFSDQKRAQPQSTSASNDGGPQQKIG